MQEKSARPSGSPRKKFGQTCCVPNVPCHGARLSVRKINGRVREELVLDLGRDVKLTLIRIEAGSFMMGSPDDELGKGVNENETMHPVTLTRDYWL